MKPLIETIISNGKNKGYCWNCKNYFKKNDVIFIFEKAKINKITRHLICADCYLKILADKIGWKGINELTIKHIEKHL